MRKQLVLLGTVALMSAASVFPAFAETGWVNRNGNWYYYDSTGAQAANRWVGSKGLWYWIEPNGVMATNKWISKVWIDPSGTSNTNKENNQNVTWFYVGGDGAAYTGWHQIDGKWYYFNDDTSMAVSTNIGSYRVGADGAMIE